MAASVSSENVARSAAKVQGESSAWTYARARAMVSGVGNSMSWFMFASIHLDDM